MFTIKTFPAGIIMFIVALLNVVSSNVDVDGGNSAAFFASDSTPLWPSGWAGNAGNRSICHSVWLRAYGLVAIDNSYIRLFATGQFPSTIS